MSKFKKISFIAVTSLVLVIITFFVRKLIKKVKKNKTIRRWIYDGEEIGI